MGKATKLLEKTKKLKQRVNKNFSKIQQLSSNPNVFDIIAEKKANTIRLGSKKVEEKVYKDEYIEEKVSEFSCKSITLQRIDFDFPNDDYGLELVVPPGIITASGIGSADEVEILGGTLEGRSLEVIEVRNMTTLRLDDYRYFSQSENGTKVRFTLNKE